jgi:hypothetical protein
MAELIGSVKVTPNTVAPGQSARVEVLDTNGQSYPASGDVIVSIDGVRAPSRYFQFPTNGTRTVTVSVIGRGYSETATATIQVTDPPLVYHRTLRAAGQPAAPGLIPFIVLRSDPNSPYTATFMLATPPAATAAAAATLAASSGSSATPTTSTDATTVTHLITRPSATPRITEAALTTPQLLVLAALQREFPTTVSAGSMRLTTPITISPPETEYVWSFGDGQTATTNSPIATHDYFGAITPEGIVFPFDVQCRIVHDNITVTRTFVLYSAYSMCRVNGSVVPPVSGDTFVTLSGDGASFSASLLVYNIESTQLTIDHVAIVPVNDDAGEATVAPVFTQLEHPVLIAPKSSALVALQVKRRDLAYGSSGKQARSFIAWFTGQFSAATVTPVLRPVAIQPQAGSLAFVPVKTAGATVRFSRHLLIRLQDQSLPGRMTSVTIDTGGVTTQKLGNINLRTAPGVPRAIVNTDAISLDPATGVVGVPLTTMNPAEAQVAQMRHTVLAALGGVIN